MVGLDIVTIVLIVIAALFLIGGIFITAIVSWVNISNELKLINIEIKRTKGRERKHYKRQKRKLLLSALPFFRR